MSSEALDKCNCYFRPCCSAPISGCKQSVETPWGLIRALGCFYSLQCQHFFPLSHCGVGIRFVAFRKCCSLQHGEWLSSVACCTGVTKTLGSGLQRGQATGSNLKVITSQNRLVYIVCLIFILPQVPEEQRYRKKNQALALGPCLKALRCKTQMNSDTFSEPHYLGDRSSIRLVSFELIITAKKPW